MKKLLAFLLLAVFSLSGYAQSNLYGDVNGDGEVNIADVNDVIGIILGGDVSQDDKDWVDLGLPSGTLWATRNVGASSPEDYGDYFAWGETEPKDYYDWSTYKLCNGSDETMTKYCTKSIYGNYGYVDYKTELDSEDDAAYFNWGPSWRMPSMTQLAELMNNCYWQWTQRNGVNGQLVTGPNGNTMFLPAAGSCWYNTVYNVGSSGEYWSRTLNSDYPNNAYYLCFASGYVYWLYASRGSGLPVRAVRVP